MWYLTQTKQFQQQEIHLLHLPATILQPPDLHLSVSYHFQLDGGVLACISSFFSGLVVTVCAVIIAVMALLVQPVIVMCWYKNRQSKLTQMSVVLLCSCACAWVWVVLDAESLFSFYTILHALFSDGSYPSLALRGIQF